MCLVLITISQEQSMHVGVATQICSYLMFINFVCAANYRDSKVSMGIQIERVLYRT